MSDQANLVDYIEAVTATGSTVVVGLNYGRYGIGMYDWHYQVVGLIGKLDHTVQHPSCSRRHLDAWPDNQLAAIDRACLQNSRNAGVTGQDWFSVLRVEAWESSQDETSKRYRSRTLGNGA